MMKNISVWKQELADGVHASRLAYLYCCTAAETAAQAARYSALLEGLEQLPVKEVPHGGITLSLIHI